MEPNNIGASVSVANDAKESQRAFIKMLLILLIIITIVQFASFGMQSVKYILGVIYGVEVVSTPLDAFIGFLAMIASVYVFTGSVFEWIEKVSATKYLTIGGSLFVVKNIFDLVNVAVLYNMENTITTADQISALASILGGQFFQLAFWVFVVAFFRIARR